MTVNSLNVSSAFPSLMKKEMVEKKDHCKTLWQANKAEILKLFQFRMQSISIIVPQIPRVPGLAKGKVFAKHVLKLTNRKVGQVNNIFCPSILCWHL